MIPHVVTTETLKKDRFQQLNLGYLIQVTTEHIHVTYHISIEKGGQTLLNEWFHHHYGVLKLEINPKSTTRIIIYAQKDPVLDMYTGTLDTRHTSGCRRTDLFGGRFIPFPSQGINTRR
jgi:hypothetical protein